MKKKDAEKAFKQALTEIRKNHLTTEIDEEWFEYPAEKRKYFMALIKAAESVEEQLGK